MRVLVGRVTRAQVTVDSQICGQIGPGLVLLVGCHSADDDQALRFCAEKCAHLRIFADDQGKMNRSIIDVGGAVLAISQFTLYADCRKGRRPCTSASSSCWKSWDWRSPGGSSAPIWKWKSTTTAP